MHGSRLTSRPGRSNDDVVCFDASFWGNCVCISLFQQWLERAKKLNDWLWPPKKRCTYVFHCPFHFKLSLRSRLVFGSQIINYLSKKIRSSLHISRISFSSAAPHTFLFLDESLSVVVAVFHFLNGVNVNKTHFPATEALVSQPWRSGLIQSMRSNRSRLQQAADNIWVHLYEHFYVQGKPRLGLTRIE